jgi:hypothetical protein
MPLFLQEGAPLRGLFQVGHPNRFRDPIRRRRVFPLRGAGFFPKILEVVFHRLFPPERQKINGFAKSRQNDGFVKSRHSRAGGNPESANTLKKLDSHFHGNDGKADFRTFYETIKIENFYKKDRQDEKISLNDFG